MSTSVAAYRERVVFSFPITSPMQARGVLTATPTDTEGAQSASVAS
jgi:hypothetical protein